MREKKMANASAKLTEAEHRLRSLSPERLKVAADFLAYLEDRESGEATEELLKIPGIVEALEKAEKDIAAGKVAPVEKLKRKY